jgi:hypothetical protein
MERCLATARSNTNMALDNIDNTEQLKELLANIDKLLRNVELQLASSRLHMGDASAAGLDSHALQWIKESTERDETSAEIHSEIEASATELGFGKTHSLNESLKDALASTPVTSLLELAGSFNFDAIAFCSLSEVGRTPISILGMYLATSGPDGSIISQLHANDRFTDCKLFQTTLLQFFQQLDDQYKPDALYHGSAHACDVMSTSAWFCTSEFMRGATNPMGCFMMLVASALHDVGHMGRNNLFYTKTMNPLAIKYNDKSVLENMHLSLSFEIMQSNEDCNWFGLLKDSQQYVRKGLISMVLATDPSKHSKHFGEFAELVQELQDNPEVLSPKRGVSSESKQKSLDDKMILLCNILHASDVSNPTKPQPMMLSWTKRLLQEFWAQGDEERSIGVPISALCDREPGMVSVPKGQLGFVTYVIQPFFKKIAEPISETKEALDQLASNVEYWQGKDAEGATFDQIFGGDGYQYSSGSTQ